MDFIDFEQDFQNFLKITDLGDFEIGFWWLFGKSLIFVILKSDFGDFLEDDGFW